KTASFIKYNNKLEQATISATGIGIGKWNRLLMPTPSGANSAKGTGINWPIMRLSDVILMYAESENELNGPTLEAQEALKLVRKRAFQETAWASKVDQYVNQVAGSKRTF